MLYFFGMIFLLLYLVIVGLFFPGLHFMVLLSAVAVIIIDSNEVFFLAVCVISLSLWLLDFFFSSN